MLLRTIPWLLAGISLLLCVGQAFAFQNLVDEIWQDRKVRGHCRNFVVQAGPPAVLRGKISGQGCLTEAIKAYREGDHEEAFGWILAGKCRDREARFALVQQAPKVMDYVMETYGSKVPPSDH